MSILRKILLAVLIILIGIQFIRPAKNNGVLDNPKEIGKIVQVPENIKLILKTACYDCHSNQTFYPWYSEIMPLGWWLNHHVEEGKEHLNFSVFGDYSKKRQDHKLEEVKEETEEKEMPLESYTWYHKNASLSDDQIKLIVDWVDAARKELKNK